LIVYCNAGAVGHYPTHSISTKSSFHFPAVLSRWQIPTEHHRGKMKKDAKHFKKQKCCWNEHFIVKKASPYAKENFCLIMCLPDTLQIFCRRLTGEKNLTSCFFKCPNVCAKWLFPHSRGC
jgi:hypothetical protein